MQYSPIITALLCALACITYVSGYTVQGNKIIDPNGKQVLLRGVDRCSFEWNPNGENANAGDYLLMAGWGSNVVRIAVNQDFWLSGSRTYSSNYAGNIDQQIQWAKAAGMGVIIDLHWSDMGNLQITAANQQLMADANSVTFWSQFAAKYSNDPWVIFELYNEPHDVSPSIWRNGGSAGGFQVYGMQQLYNAVRLAGAPNMVIVNGLNWAYDISAVYPSQAVTGTNIAYGTHPYDYPGKQAGNWDQNFGFAAATVPVIMTEFGQYCSADGYVQALLQYATTKGIHWTAWAWYPSGCEFPSIITDWHGTPEGTVGVIVKSYLQQSAGGSTPAPINFPSTTGSAGGSSGNTAVAPAANAQVIWDDSFQNGWQSWSWATVNFGVTNPVAVGSKAISMVLSVYQGLYFHASNNFQAGQYASIQFYMNAGNSANPNIAIRAYDSSNTQLATSVTMPTNAPANTWVLQTIPLTRLGLSATQYVSGFAITYGAADNNGNVIYFDQVQLVPSGSSSTTGSPATQSPTQAPTQKAATQAPTQSPSQNPTQSPTQYPTQYPTQKPATQSPTNPPQQQQQNPTQPPSQSPTQKPATQAPATGAAGPSDCSSSCGASCIQISQSLSNTWTGQSGQISQYTVTVQNLCTTMSLTALSLTASNWNPWGYWNAQVSGNQVSVSLYNPGIAPGATNTNMGYQNYGGIATFSVASFTFQ